MFCGKILGVKLVSGNAGVSRVFCENLAAGRSVLSCASQCCDLLKFTSWGCVSVTVGSNFYVCMLLLCRTQNRKHGTLDLPLGCKTELIYGLRIIFFGTLVTNYHVTQKSVGIYLLINIYIQMPDLDTCSNDSSQPTPCPLQVSIVIPGGCSFTVCVCEKKGPATS